VNGTPGNIQAARRNLSSISNAAVSSSAASPLRKTVSSPPSSVAGTGGRFAPTRPPLKTRSVFVLAESEEATPELIPEEPANRNDVAFQEICRVRAAITHLPPKSQAYVTRARSVNEVEAPVAVAPSRSRYAPNRPPLCFFGWQFGQYVADCPQLPENLRKFTQESRESYLRSTGQKTLPAEARSDTGHASYSLWSFLSRRNGNDQYPGNALRHN
jgi:hypothetical protein